jgi:hypothetical protein
VTVETPVVQFYQQAKVQFAAWLSDPTCDLDPDAIRSCIADCDRELQRLRERDAEPSHP